ncbi:MAG: hypothetical protein QME81_02160 [bacterium]|nr:hypothetical protein [bacterium]
MAVQPLDLQVNIAQQTEVGRGQQAAQNQVATHQSQLAGKAEEESRLHESQIPQDMEETGSKLNVEEREGQGRGERRRRPGHQREKEPEKESMLGTDPFRGHILDVVK